MKVKFKLFIMAIICCILLCGCNQRTIRGEVTDVTSDGFSMVLDGAESVDVTVDQHTRMFTWVADISVSDFWADTVDGIVVSVNGKMNRDGMHASEVQIEGRWIKNWHTLDDGSRVDLFESYLYSAYRLEDQSELLFVQKPTNVEDAYIPGIGSLADLPEKAQQKIKAYYDDRGLMYDVRQNLEQAYADYLSDVSEFQIWSFAQEIVPSAVNEEVIYFLTIVSLPNAEVRLCEAFDKETGEPIPMADVFTCEPEEFISRLAESSGLDDGMIEEMKAAFQPEYVTISQGYLEVNFPAGTLPSSETAFGMGFDYSKDVCELLKPWAIPNGVME